MARNNFKEFSIRFKSALKSRGYTLEKFAEKSKIPAGTLSNYSSGLNPPTPEYRIKIKELLGLSDEDFEPDLMPRRTPELIKRRVPVVSWAFAGSVTGRGFFEDLANQTEETIETTSRDPNAFAIEISGDSMEPTASHRDCVVFEPNMEAPNGWPVLVKLIDGRVFFKRLYRTEDRVLLESDNETHQNLEFPLSEIAFVYPAKDIVKTAHSRPRRTK